MNNLRFLSREKLTEYLSEELRHILNEKEIYEIDQYGWLGDGEQDPDYAGHATWQEDPPELQKLATLGNEFTHLMRSARHSLGLASLYHDTASTIFNDNCNSFSFQFTDTVNKLNLAADRIREFLITAFVRQTPWRTKSWPASGKVLRGESFHNHFCRPFRQIKKDVATWTAGNIPLLECLARLQPLAEKAADYRASNLDPARHLSFFQDRFASVATNLALGYPDEALSDSLLIEDDSLLDDLRNWYQILIEASNLVFLAEHLLRSLNHEVGTLAQRPARQQTV